MLNLSYSWSLSIVAFSILRKPIGMPSLTGGAFWHHKAQNQLLLGFGGTSLSAIHKTSTIDSELSLWGLQLNDTGPNSTWKVVLPANHKAFANLT